jgi:hypothetical protein
MKVSELITGEYVAVKANVDLYLFSDTWMHMPGDHKMVDFNVATTNWMNANLRRRLGVKLAKNGLYLGRTKDSVKIVGYYTSYNFLIDGLVYKISGYEIKNLQPAF